MAIGSNLRQYVQQHPELNQPNLGGQAQQILTQAQGQGMLDPSGSPQLRALRRRQALRHALAMRQRGQGASQLYGLDPLAARAAAQGQARQSASDVSNFLNTSDFQEQQGNQDFARGLFRDRLGVEDQIAAERRAAKRNRFNIGSALGGLAGQAGGAFLGNYFGGLGTRMSSGGGYGLPGNALWDANEMPGPTTTRRGYGG